MLSPKDGRDPGDVMAIDYEKLKHWTFADVAHTYTERDTLFYALCLGLGQDPLDRRALPYVVEGLGREVKPIPTMAAVLGFPGNWLRDSATGVTYAKVVHGENGIEIRKPLRTAGTIVSRMRVTHVVDKGKGTGALIITERQLTDGHDGDLMAIVRSVNFCRADGGFSAMGQHSDSPGESLPPHPTSVPHGSHTQATRPEAALFYRLLGDRNPLHADPQFAEEAGFDRPVLHGLATYGIAAVAIVRMLCGDDPDRLRSIAARFAAPVFPGDRICTEMWCDGTDVRFRARVPERDLVVLSHGTARVA